MLPALALKPHLRADQIDQPGTRANITEKPSLNRVPFMTRHLNRTFICGSLLTIALLRAIIMT